MKKGTLIASCILLAPLSHAAVVLQDTFDQTSGILNGLAPSHPFTQGDTWNAHDRWSVDGSGMAFTSGGFDAVASLPAILVEGNIYTLTAQINIPAGSGGDWIGFGFASGLNGDIFSGEYNPVVLLKDTGAVEYYAFPGAAGSIDGLFAPGSEHIFSITVDTREAQWTGAFGIDGTIVAPPAAFSGNPSGISRIIMTSFSPGAVSAITLEAIPEPSIYAMITGMLALMVVAIRRRI